jgi:hypothetical protein
MALADNDRISSNALNTVISALWTKIKNTFYKKPSEGIPATDLSSECQNAVSNAKDYFTIDYESSAYSFLEILAKIASGYVVRVAFIPPRSTLKYFIPFSNVAEFDESGTPTQIWFSTAASPVLVSYNEKSYIWVCISKKQDGSCKWTVDDEYFKVDWNKVKNTPIEYNPSAHSHAAGDVTSGTFDAARIPSLSASKITSGTFNSARIPNLDASKISSGTFADERIASASKWNAKQDALPTSYPSGGMTKYYIIAKEALELFQSDRGDLLFEYLGTTEVLKITMPIGKKTGLSSILVQTVAADGWPLIFMVGWNWSESAFTKGPKLSYLYTTSQSTSSKDKQATIKYSVDSIFIKVNQTQTSRKMMVSIIGGNIGDLTISNSEENAEYNAATLVSGDNVEGCVMKMNVGSAVGSDSNPVFVEASGFLKACTSVNASTWNGMSGDFTGSIPSSPSANTIYWV